jgi:hypothetical protein
MSELPKYLMSSDYLVYVLNDDGFTYTNKYLLDNFPSFVNSDFTYDILINQGFFKVEEDEFEFYQNKRKIETGKILNPQMILGDLLFKAGVEMLLILSDDSEETTLEERQMAARTIEELIGPYLEN